MKEESTSNVALSVYGERDRFTVLVLGGISATRRLLPVEGLPWSGWWPALIGAGRALDPRSHCLIGADYIGGRGDSSCTDCDGFPQTTADHARSILNALDRDGFTRIDAIVGASFGGMVGLAMCSIAPLRVGRAVIIAAAHRSDPMSSAHRALQRRIVQLGWSHGDAAEGLSIARGLAVTGYRTAREFRERFSQGGVQQYLQAHGERFAASFPAHGFLALSAALDAHYIDAASITTPLTLIGFDSDTLVPPTQLEELHRGIPSSTLKILPSRYGHDGFLKEGAALNPIVRRALATDDKPVSRVTRAVRAGVACDHDHGAVIPPLHLSTTFTFEEFGRARRYDYTRSGNPTRDQLGDAIADLEGGPRGIITATGMAAVLLPLQLLRPEDLLLAPHDGYGGTHRLLTALSGRRSFNVEFIDFTEARACDVVRARRPRMVWLETPSNPLLRITDIAAITAAAHDAGACVVVDNTFLSPALQRPLELGADIVIHSTTKYINGHSDVVGGAVVPATMDLHRDLAWWANCLGITASPFDSWLTMRGLRTLFVRIAAQESSAAAIVQDLLRSDVVQRVYYPGLDSHPGHHVAVQQQSGFGAMLSVELRGGRGAARRFVEGLATISLAESLGGVESLVAHPATMTHASMSPGARRRAGITDGLLRFSIGLECIEDLLADVRAGLERAASVDHLHSYQLDPVPVTTSSGTSSGNASSMRVRTSSDVSSSSD